MISKISERVGRFVWVFLILLVVLISKMIINFNELDFLYCMIVLFYLVKYVKLKLS